MTVVELIAELQKMDPNMVVAVEVSCEQIDYYEVVNVEVMEDEKVWHNVGPGPMHSSCINCVVIK